MRPLNLALLAISAAGILIMPGPARAESPSLKDNPTPPPVAAAKQEFTQSQIDAYAASALLIGNIISEMQPQIEAAANKADQDQLIAALNDRMMKTVIETGGISVDEYNAISDQVRSDQALADKIITAMKLKKDGKS